MEGADKKDNVDPKMASIKKERILSTRDKFPTRETRSSLPLQMALHFHIHLDPVIYITVIRSLILKYEYLHPTYRVILVAMLLISVLIECIRPYLGYYGNLGEKIPALSGFWTTTLILQIPIAAFLLINPEIYPLPLERFLLAIHLIFLVAECWTSFFLVRRLADYQVLKFKSAIMDDNVMDNNEAALERVLPQISDIDMNILPRSFAETLIRRLPQKDQELIGGGQG